MDLSYGERRFLQAYHYFLKTEYHTDSFLDMIVAQNMISFLQRLSWMHTDFEFMLSGKNGMYSSGCEASLLRLNRKKEDVKLYQSSERYYGEISVNNCKELEEFNGTYLIDWHKNDLPTWIRCLAMISFIKEVPFGRIPFSFETIFDRLRYEDNKIPESYVQEAYDLV